MSSTAVTVAGQARWPQPWHGMANGQWSVKELNGRRCSRKIRLRLQPAPLWGVAVEWGPPRSAAGAGSGFCRSLRHFQNHFGFSVATKRFESPSLAWMPGSKMEVIEVCEAFTGPIDNLVFADTKIILRRTDDGQLYFAHSLAPIPDNSTFTPEELAALELTAIPTDEIWPAFDSKFSKAPQPLPDNSYTKQTSLLDVGDIPNCKFRELILGELEICELLAQHPHPNVAEYRGCVVEDNRITGLCFARYDTTLSDKVSSGVPFDRAACLRGIEDGISHLHRLGLIHNDLNPSNVMVDVDGSNPVIIDFDSCRREGQELGLKWGTPFFAMEDMTHATRENDFYGLAKIREFLMENYCGEQG